MDKQKALKEFEKIKDHAERKKSLDDLNERISEVDVNEIRKKVYEKAREKENLGVDARSWFAKK